MISVRVNARTLAEFFCEGGDLCAAAGAAEAMRQGVIAHQARQADYRDEDRREASFSGEYALKNGILRLFGRADGVRVRGEGWCIEEIKWIAQPLPPGDSGREVHWRQACLYALMLCDRDRLSGCAVRLVYVDALGEVTALERTYERASLYAMMAEAAEPFLRWQNLLEESRQGRMDSLKSLAFPFARFRPGQQTLSRNAYIALQSGQSLVCEAPTGLGKTMGVLYAAARALGEGHIQRAFFLTARGTGQEAAETALERMGLQGSRARWVSLHAKARMCILDAPRCDPEFCPRARGYFDRRRTALADSLTLSAFSQKVILALAEKYELCPFELSLDLAETCDFVIGDYNYAFDPRVRLERFFQTKTGAALLVDEAHNLTDRAREMFSARLMISEIRDLRRERGRILGRKEPGYKAVSRFLAEWKGLFGDTETVSAPQLPESLLPMVCRLRDALAACGATDWDVYWQAVWFIRAAERLDPACDRAVWGGDGGQIWCMEPAPRLRRVLDKCHGAVFFSATLKPLDFYQDRLGAGEGALLSLPSPFPPENLQVRCVPLSTRFRDRERNMGRLVGLISGFARQTAGNLMVCFPSHAYLSAARAAFSENTGHRWLYQEKNMSPEERQAFLDAFHQPSDMPVGAFVTMGGLFTEGVDLAGDRLVGAVIVGAGLPQVSFETEALRQWYDDMGFDGYRFVYVYPGAARVTQAAGRVIRTDSDRGSVLLIDDRWMDPENRALLPASWS